MRDVNSPQITNPYTPKETGKETGKQIIEQARIVLKETQQLKAISKEVKQGTSGELRIGVIPTVAPYLLPLFLTQFLKKYPALFWPGSWRLLYPAHQIL